MSNTSNKIKGVTDFYTSLFDEFEEIKQILGYLTAKLEELERSEPTKGEKYFVAKFRPDEKIREETVRDILKLKQWELDEIKAQGLIAPVNKHNYYLVRDVMELKKNLHKILIAKPI